MASDAAEFLDEVCERLIKGGTRSRDLVELEFKPEIEHFDILLREEPHAEGYPDLASILGELSRTCTEHSVALHQLRRISFFDDEIDLELVDDEGEQVHLMYPIPRM